VPQGSRQVLCRVSAAMLPSIAGLLMTFGAANAGAQAPTGPPVNGSRPAITGAAADGKRLRATAGMWTGEKPIEYAYRWERCATTGETCESIAGADTNAYKASSEDVGHSLRVIVTARNAQSSASATSDPSAAITAAAPRKRKRPLITGSVQDGQLLSASTGTWTGTQPMSFAYQWKSCHASNCSPIAGATESTYRPVTEQIGSKLEVSVTATNGAGSASAHSTRIGPVAAGPPSSLTPPSVSGQPLIGQTLTAETGSWAGTGPFDYTYQWIGCSVLGECNEISGAQGASYTVGPLQLADSIEVIVTAHNGLGSASATSAPTSAISALIPANVERPGITGLLEDGGLLSASTGAWTGTEPLGFSYVWELCDATGGNCKAIDDPLGSTLSLITGEVGQTLRVAVTATNAGGSTTAFSEPTSLVKALLPSNAELPSIGGLAQDGSSLSGALGKWSGSEPSFSEQWLLCNSAGAACKEITGAAGSTLALITGEIGDTVRLLVTATNSAGSVSATSEPTSVVAALLPSNTKLPSIAGELIDTKTLTGTDGSWAGSEPVSYSQQWELCNSSGGACKEITGAAGSTLALITGEIGDTVRLAVTATNAGGSTTAFSEPTSLIEALIPSNIEAPSIAGVLQSGHALEALVGKWSGTEPKFSFQWQTCGLLGLEKECVSVKNAIKKTLELNLSDVGLTLRVLVTATNSAGSATKASPITSAILGLL